MTDSKDVQRSFTKNDQFVWAKYYYYPLWPAQINVDEMRKKKKLKESHRWVRFIGEQERVAEVSVDMIKDWNTQFVETIISQVPMHMREYFIDSVSECNALYVETCAQSDIKVSDYAKKFDAAEFKKRYVANWSNEKEIDKELPNATVEQKSVDIKDSIRVALKKAALCIINKANNNEPDFHWVAFLCIHFQDVQNEQLSESEIDRKVGKLFQLPEKDVRDKCFSLLCHAEI